MSRETLLDDAIAKAKEAEDWQLVEWLRMARGGESAARWYTAKLGEARLDMSKLMTENAKLRELVRDVYTLHWNGLDCTECPWFDECDTTGGCPWLSIFADHMREPGVEVEE